jgi:hypothetical protein
MTSQTRFAPDTHVQDRRLLASSVWRSVPQVPSPAGFLRAIGRTCFALVLALVAPFLMSTLAFACPNTTDYTDPTYGQKIRQLWKSDGQEHNLYYHRNPWNANNTYMVGIESDLDGQNWWVALYDGAGCFLQELFPIMQYSWQLVWDRSNPTILYTWKGSKLYRYDVTTATTQLLKSFAPLGFKPGGPSLNQAGDRIMVITSDGIIRSYRLSDMGDERAFDPLPTLPASCATDWEDIRYTGYLNYIGVNCKSSDGSIKALVVYVDTGAVFHTFLGAGFAGHYDFSPNGKVAYFKMHGGGNPLEIHVVNLDGTNDQILYSVPQTEAKYVQNLHVSWPDRVNGWFIASFFPSALKLPPAYQAPSDEILRVHTNGTVTYLARTGTAYTPGQSFWAEPLASPSSDGTRISFHSKCSNDVPMLGCIDSGTTDHYILFTGSLPSPRQ